MVYKSRCKHCDFEYISNFGVIACPECRTQNPCYYSDAIGLDVSSMWDFFSQIIAEKICAFDI